MQSGSGRGVQQAEVSGAADALLAQGQRPTVERVRRQLGRGSPNTVGPMLETWFAGLAPRLGVNIAGADSPDAAPTEIRQTMGELWRMALNLARQDAQTALATEHDRLKAQRNQVGEERAALAIESAAAAERETLRKSALERAESQVDVLALQLRAAQTALQQREGELESVRISLARAVEAKDNAQHEHKLSMQALFEERRRQEERFAANERRLLDEVDRARQEAKYAAKLLKETVEDHDANRQELKASQTKLRERIHNADIEVATLRERMQASESLVFELRKAIHANQAQGASKNRLRGKGTPKRGAAIHDRA
ncbi:MAG: DNA-binding protein [Hylemonella sp.]